MRERGIRGVGLERHSLQTGRGVAASPRRVAQFRCDDGHITEVPFSADAETPLTWECRTCGNEAHLYIDGEVKLPEPDPNAHHQRTPWDMLKERRSTEELEEILTERIGFLRDRRKRAVERARNGAE